MTKALAGTIPVYCAHDKLVPLADLRINERNPNQHSREQITLLAKIIEQQGWRAPITVSTLSGLIVRGHCRYAAAQLLNCDVVPVDYQEYENAATEYADLIADNRIAELAEVDDTALTTLLEELRQSDIDMDLTGYDSEALNRLLKDSTTEDDFDTTAEATAITKPVTQLGDIYTLGRHRLACGDCTQPEIITALMQGEHARCLWTDPPYGVSYQSTHFDVIAGDEQRGDVLQAFLTQALTASAPALIDRPALYICYATASRAAFEAALQAAGFAMRQELIWHKQLVLGRSDYQWNHEPIIYAGRPNAGPQWYGDRCQTTVLDIQRDPAKEYIHPTQKPVALPASLLRNSTMQGDIVLDPFTGSGSTLIACEQTGRTFRGVEIDPRYCDAIVLRWQHLTGGKAVRNA